MKLAPGFIRANSLAPNMCLFSAVALACTDTMSASASSVSRLTSATPSGTAAGGTGSCAITVKPSAAARAGDLAADVPEADQAERGAGASRPKNSRPSNADSARLAAVGDVTCPPAARRGSASARTRSSARRPPRRSCRACSRPGCRARVAAATSTLTGPPRAQQTSRSPGVSSTSALTGAPCSDQHVMAARRPDDLGWVARVLAEPALRRGPGRLGVGPADLQLRDGDRVAEARERRGEAADRHVRIADGKDSHWPGPGHG